MRVLAIDQSSKETGYAIFEDGQLDSYEKLSFSNKDPIERIIRLESAILEIIDYNNIEKVVLEDIQHQNSTTTYKILAFVLGALEVALTKKKIPYEVVSPSTWKSFCGVRGKARTEQKKSAAKFVNRTFEIEPPQDIVDAICLGWAATGDERGLNFS